MDPWSSQKVDTRDKPHVKNRKFNPMLSHHSKDDANMSLERREMKQLLASARRVTFDEVNIASTSPSRRRMGRTSRKAGSLVSTANKPGIRKQGEVVKYLQARELKALQFEASLRDNLKLRKLMVAGKQVPTAFGIGNPGSFLESLLELHVEQRYSDEILHQGAYDQDMLSTSTKPLIDLTGHDGCCEKTLSLKNIKPCCDSFEQRSRRHRRGRHRSYSASLVKARPQIKHEVITLQQEIQQMLKQS